VFTEKKYGCAHVLTVLFLLLHIVHEVAIWTYDFFINPKMTTDLKIIQLHFLVFKYFFCFV